MKLFPVLICDVLERNQRSNCLMMVRPRVWMKWLVPETPGRNLQEIQNDLGER